MVRRGVGGGWLCQGMWIIVEIEECSRSFELFVDLLCGGGSDGAKWGWSLYVGVGGVKNYVEDGGGEKVGVIVDKVLNDHVREYGVDFMLSEWAG